MSRFIFAHEALSFLEGYLEAAVSQEESLAHCHDRRSKRFAIHEGKRDAFAQTLARVRELQAPLTGPSPELNPSGSVAQTGEGTANPNEGTVS